MWGWILVLIGIAVLGDNLNWFSFDIWNIFLPAVLIVVGIQLVLRRSRRVEVVADIPAASASPSPSAAATADTSNRSYGTDRKATDTDRINESHVMGEVDLSVDSPSFRGGAASTVFGEVRLDLGRAHLAEGEQHLAVNTVFGEVRIYVPPDWEYSVDATTVFGEVEAGGTRRGGIFSNVVSATPNYSAATRKLRISTSTVFGEVRVIAR